MSKPTPQHSQPPPNAASTSAPTSTEAPKEWQEDDYILALAHLEKIQYTISSLRLTIPQLIRSLTRQHPNPQSLFVDFRTEVVGSSRKLADLKSLWEGSEMRGIQEVVERGVRARGYGVGDDGAVRDMVEGMGRYGWIEEGAVVRERKRKREGKEESDIRVLKDEEVEQVVGEFAKRNEAQGVKAVFEKGSEWRIEVDYKSTDGMPLHFDIRKGTSTEGRGVYSITGPRIPENATEGETKLFKAIERCLGKRLKQSDLEHTLDMVAAYKDLREAKCHVCKKILDREGMFPAVRNSRKVGEEPATWVAEHESCTTEKGRS